MRSAATADLVQHRGDASLLAAKVKPARPGANAAALHAAPAHTTTATALTDTILKQQGGKWQHRDHTANLRSVPSWKIRGSNIWGDKFVQVVRVKVRWIFRAFVLLPNCAACEHSLPLLQHSRSRSTLISCR
jgi:hypothetical protein